MSIVYCHDCDKYIDTDYDTEHFIEGTETCYESSNQKNMKWIEIGEEVIPNDGNNILAMDEHGGIANVYFDSESGEWMFETFGTWILTFPYKIISWMPLPELEKA